MVLVKWWGNARFEVRDEVVLVIDPHDGESVNMDPPRVKADIVLVSHSHGDHDSGRGIVTKTSEGEANLFQNRKKFK